MLHSSPGTSFDVMPECPMSLQRFGEEEANRFKWIQSEKEGRDLGDQAIRLWIAEHWHGFLRHHWLEHLHGTTFWIELAAVDFGVLLREFQDSPMIGQILERLKMLMENLEIIIWAREKYGQESMGEVLRFLEAIDVNACRLRCEFYPGNQP
jgi:hypothetical protein